MARWFAGHVAAVGDERVLRYSTRLDLLTMAERVGINRFQANLIIAAAEHHRSARPPADTITRRRVHSMIGPLLVFLPMQIAIVLAVWYLVGG